MPSLRPFVRAAQAFVPRRNGVAVLTYHLVGAGTCSPVDISAGLFRAHLDELAARAHVLSLEEAVRQLRRRAPIAPRTVVLTFDDAYANFYTRVFPLLQEYRMPATLYVPTHFVAGKAPPPIAETHGLPACTWGQLREMQQGGLVTVGAHTCTHPSLPDVSRARARWEIEASGAVLEERLGAPVRSFCYPRGLWTRALEEVVRRTYDTAVIGGGALQRPARFDAHRIRRVPIRSDAPPTLRPMLEGAVWLEERAADWFRRYAR